MKRKTADPAQIIDAKGGPAKFAEAIGSTPGAVRMMKLRRKFPRTVWPEIMTAYPEFTLEKLKQIERAPRAPSAIAKAA